MHQCVYGHVYRADCANPSKLLGVVWDDVLELSKARKVVGRGRGDFINVRFRPYVSLLYNSVRVVRSPEKPLPCLLSNNWQEISEIIMYSLCMGRNLFEMTAGFLG